MDDELIGYNRAALNEIALNGNAHEGTRDSTRAYHKIIDHTGLGEKVLNRRITNVGKVNLGVCNISVCRVKLSNLEVFNLSFVGGKLVVDGDIIGLKFTNIRLNRVKLTSNSDIFCLKFINFCLRGVELIDVRLVGNDDVKLFNLMFNACNRCRTSSRITQISSQRS